MWFAAQVTGISARDLGVFLHSLVNKPLAIREPGMEVAPPGASLPGSDPLSLLPPSDRAPPQLPRGSPAARREAPHP
jgi:hypothetical protein